MYTKMIKITEDLNMLHNSGTLKSEKNIYQQKKQKQRKTPINICFFFVSMEQKEIEAKQNK